MPKPLHVVHVITGLGLGGAERALSRMAGGLRELGFRQSVISLTDRGPLADEIESVGVPVHALNLKRQFRFLKGRTLLRSELEKLNPDVVQSWMYHADWLTSAANPSCPIVWGIRNSTLTRDASKLSTRWVRGRCAKLSYSSPSQIISCSRRAASIHTDLGYDGGKMEVIPNGIRLDRFRFSDEQRGLLRSDWKIDDSQLVFAHAARLHPQKGHTDFLTAAIHVARLNPNARFVLVGEGVDSGLIQEVPHDLHHAFRFLGPMHDMAGFLSASDFFVMSSVAGEAFPNVVAEAMACGRPCVVTDVGDAADIVGATGVVVLPGEPKSLALAMLEVLAWSAENYHSASTACVLRIQESYELSRVAEQFAQVYYKVVGDMSCAA